MKWILKLLLFLGIIIIAGNYAMSNLIITKISLKEKVYINNNVVNYLNNKYETSKVELGMCMYGTNNGTNYIIDKVEVGLISNSTNSEIFFGCPVNSLGRLHSHTDKICYFSQADLYAFGTTKYNIDGLMCEKNKFIFQFSDSSTINNFDWQYGYGVVMPD